MRMLILFFTRKIRNEDLNLGDFSNSDLFYILIVKVFSLIRGFLFINIPKFEKGFFFLGYRSVISGRSKIYFNSSVNIGNNVKISAIGSKYFRFGKNFSIRDFSIIDSFGSMKNASGYLEVGNNVGISEQCYLGLRGNLIIGNDVIIGPGVKIFTENHSMKLCNLPFRLQEEIRNDVYIGNNVWIGSGVIILPGVSIADNSVVAAGCVVTTDVAEHTIVGGIPSKVIKNII